MLELFRIAGKIELDGADKAEKSLDRVDKKAEGFGSKLGGFAKNVGKAGAVVGGAMTAAGGAAFAMTQKVTSSFDDISKGAQRVGVSTDFYQEMDFWASQNGLSHERMEKAVGRFNQRLGQAVNGNEKYSSALTQLGINLDEVRNGTLSTEDAYAQTIQRLSEMESEQDQVNLATEIFGTRMARDMLPALQDGALSIDEARQKAQELGLVIGEDALAAGVKFQDTWDQLKRSMTTAGQQIMANLIPIFQTMMDWVLDHMPQIQAIFETVFDVIGTVFSTAVEWVQALISWLSEWFSSNEETMTGIWETIQEKFNLVVEFLQTAWETIKQFWEENGQAILDYVVFYFEQIWETIKVVFDAVWSIIQQVLELAIPFIQEKLAQIQQFWDENGEKIMQAVENAFTFIRGVIDFIMPIITAIIEGAWDIITAVFDTAVGVIMGIVDFLASLLTGDFEGMRDALTGIWESLWDGIKGIVEGAWNLLSGAFGALWDNVSGWFSDLKDKAIDWGKNMIQGFIDGIKSMGERVANAASDIVDRAADFIKFWSPAKKGEGRYITEWGRNMVDGFLDGVRDEASEAGRVMNDVISRMNPEMNANATVGSRRVAIRRTIQPAQTTPLTNPLLTDDNNRVIALLQEIANGIRAGQVIVMDERVVGRIIEPHVTETQERNRVRRERFAT